MSAIITPLTFCSKTECCDNNHIFNSVHEAPMAGRLGMKKTHGKVLNHFYWPGLWPGVHRDVKKFIRCCHACQMVLEASCRSFEAHPSIR